AFSTDWLCESAGVQGGLYRLEPKAEVGHLLTMHFPSRVCSNLFLAAVNNVAFLLNLLAVCSAAAETDAAETQRLLYAGAPGIRDYLEYGGHGILVFDISDGHRFIKRIPFGGVDERGKPLNVKGIAASAATKRL